MKTKLLKYFIISVVISTFSLNTFSKSKIDLKQNGFNITIHDSKFNTKPIVENSPDGTFIITLQANPTTGYQWFLQDYNTDIIKLIDHKYIPPQNTKLMGAPGTAQWTFKAKHDVKAPVVTQIKLLHKRAFEKTNENDSTEVITVYIQPK